MRKPSSQLCSLALIATVALLFVAKPCQAGSDTLKIKRLQISFANLRAETTVDQHTASLQAHLDVHYSGSGLLQGYWEVDGQVFSHVQRLLEQDGGSVTFTTPGQPSLPTWRSGSHRLRFVLKQPTIDEAVPEALYFVVARQAIILSAPINGARLGLRAQGFAWTSTDSSEAYLLNLTDAQGTQLFAIYTKGTSYTMSSATMRRLLHPGQTYYWQVVAYDAQGFKSATSKVHSFKLSVP